MIQGKQINSNVTRSSGIPLQGYEGYGTFMAVHARLPGN